MENNFVNNLSSGFLIVAFLVLFGVIILLIMRRFNFVSTYGWGKESEINILEIKYIDNYNMLVSIKYRQEIILLLVGRSHGKVISKYEIE